MAEEVSGVGVPGDAGDRPPLPGAVPAGTPVATAPVAVAPVGTGADRAACGGAGRSRARARAPTGVRAGVRRNRRRSAAVRSASYGPPGKRPTRIARTPISAAATPPRVPASRPTRRAAAARAPRALSEPSTTIAANHSRPRTGSYAAASKARRPMPSMPPPSAASAAPATKAISLRDGTWTPAACAPRS